MKAQVEAPIELFVAVIILASSMALAFMVMQQTDESKCVSVLKTETDKLQSAMLDVALGSPPTSRSVFFKMPRCGGTDVRVLQFVYYADAAYCKLCPSHYGDCWQIIPAGIKEENGGNVLVPVTDAISCVNMAGSISILSLSGSECPGGVSLTASACPDGIDDCNARLPSSLHATWNSFYKKQDGKTYELFNITLTKGVTASSGGEVGQIKVCVQPMH